MFTYLICIQAIYLNNIDTEARLYVSLIPATVSTLKKLLKNLLVFEKSKAIKL